MSAFPPPPGSEAPWDRGPRLLTPSTGALTVMAVYVLAAYAAYLTLRPFPSPIAFWTYVLVTPLAAAVGGWVGAIPASDERGRALVLAVLLGAGLPFALAIWLPGVTQEREHPFPGGPDVVTAAEPDGNVDLYLTPDGDPSRRIELTDTPVRQERYPSLSPDGRSVVYAADVADGSTDLFLMTLGEDHRPIGSRSLLDGPNNLSESSWSPDGTTLLVTSSVEGRADLFRFDVAAETLEPFARNAWNPEWSPDGTLIAFTSSGKDDPDDTDVFVMDADGRHRRLVIDTGFDDGTPHWSPDGDRLVFTSEVHDGDADVFVVDLDGSGLRILTADHSGYDEARRWGPEGDIYFLSDRNGVGGVFGYLMEPDGSDVRLFERL